VEDAISQARKPSRVVSFFLVDQQTLSAALKPSCVADRNKLTIRRPLAP